MACNSTLSQSTFTFRIPSSGTLCGFGFWEYTIVSNVDGTLGVSNIKSPKGTICGNGVQIPDSVFQCIQESKEQVENILAVTSAVNGTIPFVNQTAASVIFATPFPNPNYRVHVSLDDFISYRIRNQTTTGFDIELNVTYTGDVGYDVFA